MSRVCSAVGCRRTVGVRLVTVSGRDRRELCRQCAKGFKGVTT